MITITVESSVGERRVSTISSLSFDDMVAASKCAGYQWDKDTTQGNAGAKLWRGEMTDAADITYWLMIYERGQR